jgi:preprotein translocase subunit SecE
MTLDLMLAIVSIVIGAMSLIIAAIDLLRKKSVAPQALSY